jgi:hypothetical protein
LVKIIEEEIVKFILKLVLIVVLSVIGFGIAEGAGAFIGLIIRYNYWSNLV